MTRHELQWLSGPAAEWSSLPVGTLFVTRTPSGVVNLAETYSPDPHSGAARFRRLPDFRVFKTGDALARRNSFALLATPAETEALAREADARAVEAQATEVAANADAVAPETAAA